MLPPRHALLVVALSVAAASLLCCTAVATTVTTAATPLVPFDYVNGQLIDLDTGVQLYRLEGLKPRTGYELRVSFPASIPAAVKLALVGPPSSSAAAEEVLLHRRAARRLLDTEKLIFSTDAQGAVDGIAHPHLELRAFRRSVHRDGPKAGAPKLVYNVVLAELVVGLPKDSVPTIVTIVLVVLVSLVASLVLSNRLFPQLLDFLTDSESPSGKTAAVAAAVTAVAASRSQRSKRSQ